MKMRIATFVSGNYSIPPPKGVIFAPMLIAKAVAEGLTKKGHQVSFFAPKGSRLKIRRLKTGNLPSLNGPPRHKIFKDPDARGGENAKIANLWDQYFISLIYQEALRGKYDLIHIHPVDRALPFGLAFRKIPIVYTLHDPIYPWRSEIFKMFQSKNQYYISLSNAQRKPAPNLNWAGTVYNGTDLKFFPFSGKPKDYCLFLGRLLPTKGVKEAIMAAEKAGEKLIIAGTPNEGKYWEKEIKPHLKKNIKYVGNIPYEKTYKYYGKAKVALYPIQWEEPFGLTFIESMACGTPAIAFNRGSAKEVIKNGKTGFVVKDINEMVKAIKKIDKISRWECRKWVEKNFTIEKMVDNYEKTFFKILKSTPH